MRQAAAGALGQLGSGQPDVVSALLTALTNSDPDVQQAAASALATLPVERTIISRYIEGLLNQSKSLASKQLEAHETINALFFALDRVI